MAGSGVGSASEMAFASGVLPRGISFRIRMGKVACAVRAICGSAEMLADSMLMINLMVE
jgi:hypothetical protein